MRKLVMVSVRVKGEQRAALAWATVGPDGRFRVSHGSLHRILGQIANPGDELRFIP